MKLFPLPEKKKKILFAVLSFLALMLFWGILFAVAGKPMLEMFDDPAGFRAWVETHGIGGKLLFIGFMVFQVLVSVIPSEPLELGAGYAFGTLEGMLLCLIGSAIGTAIIFAFARRFGIKLVEFFLPREKIDSFAFLKTEEKLRTFTFILYLIPGIPKDIVTWIMPLTRIPFLDFMVISSIARIFPIITSTISGSALGEERYVKAIVAFVATALIGGIGLLVFHAVNRRRLARKNKKDESEDEHEIS